jgi:hypothetical protein
MKKHYIIIKKPGINFIQINKKIMNKQVTKIIYVISF